MLQDTFYSSTDTQIVNKFAEDAFIGDVGEPRPFTQILVAALSGGGVAPGDPVGGTDRELVMMSCTTNGTLLKPSSPAVYLDRVWLGDRTVGEASVGTTVLHGNDGSSTAIWKFLLCINNTAVQLTPSDVGLRNASNNYVAYEFCSSRPRSRVCKPFNVHSFSVDEPLAIASANTSSAHGDAQLIVLAPVLPCGWVFLGEADKLVPVSQTRFASYSCDSRAGLTVHMTGAPGEVVRTAACAYASGLCQAITTACTIGSSGHASVAFSSRGGTCS